MSAQMPGMFNLIWQDPTNHFIYMATSSDGTLASLTMPTSPLFGNGEPAGQSGGIIAVTGAFTQPGWRIYFACRSNDGSNVVMLGSIGYDGSLSPFVSTGLDIIGDPNPSCPALVYNGTGLDLFYRPHYNGQGRGDCYVASIAIDVANGGGGFSVGTSIRLEASEEGIGRIMGILGKDTSGNQVSWCTYYDPEANGGYGNTVMSFNERYAGSTTWSGRHYYNPAEWLPSPRVTSAVIPIGTFCPFTRPVQGRTDQYQVGAAWSGQLTYTDPVQLFWSLYRTDGTNSWTSPTAVPGITPNSEPTVMAAADGTCVYIAYRGIGNVMTIYRVAADFSAVLEHQTYSNITPVCSPALLCCFGGGIPPGG